MLSLVEALNIAPLPKIKITSDLPPFKYRAPVKEHTPVDIIQPHSFSQYVGQRDTVDLLKLTIEAAKADHRPLPNILISGSYGSGKSTLARLVLQAMGEPATLIDASTVGMPITLSGTIGLDEIHNLKTNVADSLNIEMDAGRLHVVGATTNLGALPLPFRSRFRVFNLEDYNRNEIERILNKILTRKRVVKDKSAVRELARRSRLNPRTAINYLSIVFDVMVTARKPFTKETVDKALAKLGVDSEGFTKVDHQYLDALSFSQPVGLNHLTTTLGIDKETIQTSIEPWLLKKHVIQRTPRGRLKLEEI